MPEKPLALIDWEGGKMIALDGLTCGAEGQNRTADTMIFSHVLYQLSYLGARERWQDFRL
jgi:hypothetical protein